MEEFEVLFLFMGWVTHGILLWAIVIVMLARTSTAKYQNWGKTLGNPSFVGLQWQFHMAQQTRAHGVTSSLPTNSVTMTIILNKLDFQQVKHKRERTEKEGLFVCGFVRMWVNCWKTLLVWSICCPNTHQLV